MKKHAFLIIAHNEFDVLQRLIDALDDVRVDFYVHIDEKVRDLPKLSSHDSKIFFTKQRVDTRWGDYSQIETELALFSEAVKEAEYSFYHLISGVHYPLMTVDSILGYYAQYEGKNVMNGLCQSTLRQETLKLRHYNFFTRHFSYGSRFSRKVYQRLWRLSDAIQGTLGVRRNPGVSFYKAANWVTMSTEGIHYIVEHAETIKSLFHNTFCGDEYFVPTMLLASPLKDSVVNDEGILMQVMGDSSPKVLTFDDIDAIMSSGCVFARKFSCSHMDVLDEIDKYRK